MNSDVLYPYAVGDRLEDRNTYFYTPYEGMAFFPEWRRSRERVRAKEPKAPPPPVPKLGGERSADSLLERAMDEALATEASARLPDLVDAFLRRFELTKRVHGAFTDRFRAQDPSDYGNLDHYLRLAEVLEAAYARTGDLRALNTLIKVVDTLIACSRDLTGEQGQRLSWLASREMEHVETLAAQKGLSV